MLDQRLIRSCGPKCNPVTILSTKRAKVAPQFYSEAPKGQFAMFVGSSCEVVGHRCAAKCLS